MKKKLKIPVDNVELESNLVIPDGAKSIVLFSHGSGSSRLSPRNNFVAEVLQKAGIGTLLFDLLTEEEDEVYETRFNIGLLTERLIGVTKWLIKELPKIGPANSTRLSRNSIGPTSLRRGPSTGPTIGYFGASTGAASALYAAAKMGDVIGAVVSRGGRPDMALSACPDVKSPTLLIVGGDDVPVIGMNKEALDALRCEKKLEIIPGATHLFEEEGTLEKAAELAKEWFKKYLQQ
ncbi:dienelactone hydrolase family protein [Patescibacteria group bacterium]|nr:dienelactone hydrolase family protein [Patescibacteria group bacterium]MBU1682982.1 dienelactone hydrolase family protein [Patescibacteria group bacterium]MBU1934951.1 dienelactone hydrolase family protein [Patescibacteria group bacterium]